jgi:DNA-directed RNA polymerase specialized sigma24 family protein
MILNAVDGLSTEEVAECFDVTVPTAKARAHQARALLRQRLGEFMSGAPSAVQMVS